MAGRKRGSKVEERSPASRRRREARITIQGSPYLVAALLAGASSLMKRGRLRRVTRGERGEGRDEVEREGQFQVDERCPCCGERRRGFAREQYKAPGDRGQDESPSRRAGWKQRRTRSGRSLRKP